MKSCNICFKSEGDHRIIDASSYRNIFIQIMEVKVLSELWLCTWCIRILRRVSDLREMFLETHENVLKKGEKMPSNLSTKLFKFSYYSAFVDIPPSEKEIQTLDTEKGDEVCVKVELHEQFHVVVGVDEDPCESDIKENITHKTKSRHDNADRMKQDRRDASLTWKKFKLFETMDFEVKFLSIKEQIEDMNTIRTSKRYSEMNHNCDLCGKGFVCLESYEEHKIRHTLDAGVHICPICKLHFKSRDVLTQHSLAHKRRFTCLLCRAQFKRWAHCVGHRYKCCSSVAVNCRICSKIFSDEYSLSTHMQGVHRKHKIHACKECGKSFSNKQRLLVHSRSHTGNKPFACKVCSKSFTTNSNLKSHGTVHTTDRNYYCVECNSYYKTNKGLQRHFTESARHFTSDVLKYECPLCSKRFSSEKRLGGHTKTRHLTSYKCTECDKTFASAANLKKHTRCVHTENKSL